MARQPQQPPDVNDVMRAVRAWVESVYPDWQEAEIVISFAGRREARLPVFRSNVPPERREEERQ